MRHYITLMLDSRIAEAAELTPENLTALEFPKLALPGTKIRLIWGHIVPDTPQRQHDQIVFTMEVQYEGPIISYQYLKPGTEVQFIPTDLKSVGPVIIEKRWEVPARREDWKLQEPNLNDRRPLAYRRDLTSVEYKWLILGETPLSMDDHWFAYFADGHLYWHRSWTGLCVYEVELTQVGDEAEVTTAWLYDETTNSAFSAELLSRLIETKCKTAQAVYE